MKEEKNFVSFSLVPSLSKKSKLLLSHLEAEPQLLRIVMTDCTLFGSSCFDLDQAIFTFMSLLFLLV